MAVTGDRAIFWYGCNMTRHGEVIRATTRILEAVGMDAAPAGGPANCCGSPKDASARINEGMARRTIEGFNARLGPAAEPDPPATPGHGVAVPAARDLQAPSTGPGDLTPAGSDLQAAPSRPRDSTLPAPDPRAAPTGPQDPTPAGSDLQAAPSRPQDSALPDPDLRAAPSGPQDPTPPDPDPRGAPSGQRTAGGRGQVVTWCPSCHMNMQDSMAPVTPTNFETVHVTEVLWARRERLAPLLTRCVEARVLLHAHHGFNGRVAVNDLVPGLLRLIPGVTVVEHAYRAPGHMCSAISAVPGALADAQRATLAAAAETGADTLCTIFHSCHRESVALERHGVRVVNWIHLLAASMGIAAEDEYKAWRNAADPRAAIGAARIEAAGEVAFTRLVEAELRRPPTV